MRFSRWSCVNDYRWRSAIPEAGKWGPIADEWLAGGRSCWMSETLNNGRTLSRRHLGMGIALSLLLVINLLERSLHHPTDHFWKDSDVLWQNILPNKRHAQLKLVLYTHDLIHLIIHNDPGMNWYWAWHFTCEAKSRRICHHCPLDVSKFKDS